MVGGVARRFYRRQGQPAAGQGGAVGQRRSTWRRGAGLDGTAIDSHGERAREEE